MLLSCTAEYFTFHVHKSLNIIRVIVMYGQSANLQLKILLQELYTVLHFVCGNLAALSLNTTEAHR